LRRNSEQDVEKVFQLCSRIAQRLNVPPRVRFASSLAAAALEGLFEHPAAYTNVCSPRYPFALYPVKNVFLQLANPAMRERHSPFDGFLSLSKGHLDEYISV
jgi:hypothetical protein